MFVPPSNGLITLWDSWCIFMEFDLRWSSGDLSQILLLVLDIIKLVSFRRLLSDTQDSRYGLKTYIL